VPGIACSAGDADADVAQQRRREVWARAAALHAEKRVSQLNLHAISPVMFT